MFSGLLTSRLPVPIGAGTGLAAYSQVARSRSAMVTAFIASALVVRPFLGFIRRAGFAPFAWYRIALGLLIFAALAAGWN